eukprot:COSAG04_NODE_27916_length_279_cov_0.572222_1_plen_48_part_10
MSARYTTPLTTSSPDDATNTGAHDPVRRCSRKATGDTAAPQTWPIELA